MPSEIRLGIVGACGRGAAFKAACDAHRLVKIQAVCDSNADQLPAAATRLGAIEHYTNYDEMLEKSSLDAVIIATPMPLHAPQAIAALQRNIHVLSEVPAAVSVEESQQLTLACRASKAIYMMAENYLYTRQNTLITELVRRGLFGQAYFAEAEYIHELKALNERTRWRRQWQTGINGITYPTHSLGPVLQWMPGDRVASVCCAGSGHHYKDSRGENYQNEDSVVMLCRMVSGNLVKVRVDMLSDRPHAMNNHQLQGTDGCYESARAPGETDRIWLRSISKAPNRWMPLADLEEQFLPDMWKQASADAAKSGHGGGDYFVISDFLDAVLGKRLPAVGIDAAMDMTLPGLISQQSIANAGRWMNVPDSRKWTDAASLPKQQLHMVWPDRLLGKPLEVRIPTGYRLRQFQPSDSAQYAALMAVGNLGTWDDNLVESTHRDTLSDAFFVVEHIASGRLAATAMALHRPTKLHPHGGELGWVAADPADQGKGLGYAVCAAVVNVFMERGYKHIYLSTDDPRIPAIATYLKMGFEPMMYLPDMDGRWQTARDLIAAHRR